MSLMHNPKADAESNPSINIQLGEKQERTMYSDSGTFFGIGQTPQMMSSIRVDNKNFTRARIQISVNWMAMPTMLQQAMEAPMAIFAISYIDAEELEKQQLLLLEQAVAEASMPTTTTYSMEFDDLGPGVYELLAEIDQSTMNSVEIPGEFSMMVTILDAP